LSNPVHSLVTTSASTAIRPLYGVKKKRVRSCMEKSFVQDLRFSSCSLLHRLEANGKQEGANSDDLDTDEWVHLADSGIEIVLDTRVGVNGREVLEPWRSARSEASQICRAK
jgi:hypothetical protein